MTKYRVTTKESTEADRVFDTFEEALRLKDDYEMEDRANDCYEANYYFIITEDI